MPLDCHVTALTGRATRAPSGSATRAFLFLQSLPTRFFERLGSAIAARGYRVYRVNFNGGDRAFWRLGGGIDFRGREHEWPDFFDRLSSDNAISDIILFADCRPLHRIAIGIARARGIRIHVVEEGYFRPGWITFEQGGTNGYSSLPRDPEWFRREARGLPQWSPPPQFADSFKRRASEDLRYNFASLAASRRFPNYRTHRPYHQFVEYAGWVRRLALKRYSARRTAEAIRSLQGAPIYLFPLQLDCDYQTRLHSPFRATYPAIEHVVRSFASCAPSTARLIVKLHPLDSGIIDWEGMVCHIACDAGAAERVTVLDGGNIPDLLSRCQGVVTVNSTLGAEALADGRPVIALGKALYDLPGLTFGRGLDRFWTEAAPPDAELFDAFRRVLAARCLIPGSFFCEAGLRLAVEAAVGRLEAVETCPARQPAQPDTVLAAE
jgi:capsular polysaccharide export protein